MPQMSQVELHAAVRRDHRAGMKMRELERRYNVSWPTVKKAVDSVWPEPREELPPPPAALDPCKPVIDEMLRGTNLDAAREQSHGIMRIFHRLVQEHGSSSCGCGRTSWRGPSPGMAKQFEDAHDPGGIDTGGRCGSSTAGR